MHASSFLTAIKAVWGISSCFVSSWNMRVGWQWMCQGSRTEPPGRLSCTSPSTLKILVTSMKYIANIKYFNLSHYITLTHSMLLANSLCSNLTWLRMRKLILHEVHLNGAACPRIRFYFRWKFQECTEE